MCIDFCCMDHAARLRNFEDRSTQQRRDRATKQFESTLRGTEHSEVILGVVRYDMIWVFPKIGVPENGWFIVEHPIKMDDLGVPLFFGNIHMNK